MRLKNLNSFFVRFGMAASCSTTRNTFLYNFVFIVLNLVLAVLVALLINEIKDKAISRFYQSTFLLPHIISMVVVAYLVYSFLNVDSGLVNRLLIHWFGSEAVSWYGEPKYWPYILVIVNAWKNVGYLSIIYFASIIGIDKEYYEAATIDGATKWKQMSAAGFYQSVVCLVLILVANTAVRRINKRDALF
ncbi:ABC transporter permease subunit [Paenibacillus lautus]|uniref:ABC transporter permease subunit n=1 Tax=Paenibacillus lautus TaxID=1401 RepID=UPI003D29F710